MVSPRIVCTIPQPTQVLMPTEENISLTRHGISRNPSHGPRKETGEPEGCCILRRPRYSQRGIQRYIQVDHTGS